MIGFEVCGSDLGSASLKRMICMIQEKERTKQKIYILTKVLICTSLSSFAEYCMGMVHMQSCNICVSGTIKAMVQDLVKCSMSETETVHVVTGQTSGCRVPERASSHAIGKCFMQSEDRTTCSHSSADRRLRDYHIQ